MQSKRIQKQQSDNTKQSHSVNKIAETTSPLERNSFNLFRFPVRSGATPHDISLTPQNINFLQRTLGNQSVGQMIQAKLKIGQPGDKYEQEADQVAGQGMSMEEPNIQRQTEEEEEEDKFGGRPVEKELQRQVEEEEKDFTQPNGWKNFYYLDSDRRDIFTKGKEHLLNKKTQRELGSNMRNNFSNVKIHNDITATRLLKAIEGKPFADGTDTNFNASQYTPNSGEGDHLLDHELAHTIQQKGDIVQPIIQRAPAKEVPDLNQKVVDKIKAALVSGDKDKAIQLILNALVAKNPVKFNKNLLHQNKLHTKSGSSSDTTLGPAFTSWLSGELAKGPAHLKTNEAKVRAYLSKLTVPKDKLDIKVRIAEEAFENVPRLYSTIRHEWVHVEQFKAKPLEYMSTSEFPSEYKNPSEDDVLKAREVEAYLWEAEHMDQTGIKNRPFEIWNVWNSLKNTWSGITLRRGAPFKARFKAAVKTTWEKAFDGYLKKAESIISGVGKSGISATDFKKLEEMNLYLKGMWAYRNNHNIVWRTFKDRYFKFKGVILTKRLEDIDTKIKKGSITKGIDGYNLWEPLLNEWINLDATIQKTREKKYGDVMPKLFDTVFTLFEKEFTADHAKGDKSFLESYLEFMGTMLLNYRNSKVKKSKYQKRLNKMKKMFREMK